MSIFAKITLLFCVSFLLMLAIGYQIDTLNEQKREVVITQKYLQDARKLFTLLATTEPDALAAKLAPMGLSVVNTAEADNAVTMVEQPHSFGALKILKNRDGDFLLFVRYMDASLLLSDKALQERLRDQWLPKTLVGLDIVVLGAIFFIILAMLAPLRRITETMRAFAAGDYGSRTKTAGNDEIGEVAATYNAMAQRLQELINAREELLRDIGHELRTPIARGLFTMEKLPHSKEKRMLQHCFSELDRLTAELLQIEKLDAMEPLQNTHFDAETLILDALSKAMVEEERMISVAIETNFIIEGDRDYLALALKNLIVNALKYTSAYPVTLTADEHLICVENPGEPLSSNFEHYLQPFKRDERARQSEGFGLGLGIVTKVLKRHGFTLAYSYENGRHRFCIRFNPVPAQ